MNIADIYWLFMNNPYEFKRHIDDLPAGKALLFDDLELLNCVPNKATLALYKVKGKYAMRLAEKVTYNGWNTGMEGLKDGEPVTFNDSLMMRRFLEELSFETESMSNVSTGVLSTGESEIDSITNMTRLSTPSSTAQRILDYKEIQKELGKHVMGQDAALETVAFRLAMHVNKKHPTKPESIYLYGEPGTGKSELAKAIPKVLSKLSNRQYDVVWTDANTCTEAHHTARFLGSPPGYVAHESKNAFDKVTETPFVVYVLDEIEKAHSEVLKMLMAVLDEGRCASLKQLPDGSWEYNFRHALLVCTSNLQLNETPKKRIGFGAADDIGDIHSENGAVEISYPNEAPEDEAAAVTKRIYRETESARKAFAGTGVLREIASRFGAFVECKKLSDEAKVRILAKQVVTTALEYNLRLSYIAPAIMQALIDASMSENTLTVRSYKAVIEGYLAATFAEAGGIFEGRTVRLEGAIDNPTIIPT